MEATITITRRDGSELFRDERDMRNFREVLSYLPGEDDLLFENIRATAFHFEMQPRKAVVQIRIFGHCTPIRVAQLICRYYDDLLCLRYSLRPPLTKFVIKP